MFVDPVSPSTDCESYTNATFGDGPPGAGGTCIGYDHDRSPVCGLTFHDDAERTGVAPKLPVPVELVGDDTAATTTFPNPSSGERIVAFEPARPFPEPDATEDPDTETSGANTAAAFSPPAADDAPDVEGAGYSTHRTRDW